MIYVLSVRKRFWNGSSSQRKENNMKVYIAGKITGDSTYLEKFRKAQKALEGEGFIVLNPAELPEGMLSSD